MSAAAAVTVAGAGNRWVAPDRVGPAVLDRLGDRLGDEVELVDLGAAGLALLDHLRGQEMLVVVDACLSGATPGALRVSAPDLESTPGPSTSVHQLGPEEALITARHLDPETLPAVIWLVQVETAGLSEEGLERAAAAAALRVEGLVEAWRQGRHRIGACHDDQP